jgi:acetyl esterase/lipase
MFKFSGLLITLWLALSGSALPTSRQYSTRAIEPADDPFYQPPSGFESAEPGSILKTRRIEAGFLGFIADPIEAHQLLYRTTAIDGSAIATVTTIFIPRFGHIKTDRYISYHTAYDSSAPLCNPSYVFQYGSQQWGLIASLEKFLMEIYLFLGYIVVSPDYEGPDAAFAVGRLEATGVLDGMRAVNNYANEIGLTTNNPKIVGMGYSGGAIATGWAAALQSTYAPELDVVGWSSGGTPANLTGVLDTIDGTLFSGFLPAAVVGLLAPSAYGATLGPLVDSIATEEGKAALEFAGRQCAVLDLLRFMGQNLRDTTFQSLGKELLWHPDVAAVLHECTIGLDPVETPIAPTFVYHAIRDEIIPYSNASSMVDRWCDAGADVKFTTYAAGGHATTLVLALPAIVKFTEDAFAGTLGYSGCTANTDLTNSLDPLALGVDLEPILVELVNELIAAGEADELLLNLGRIAEIIAPP